MAPIVAVALEPTVARVAYRDGGAIQTTEYIWDPTAPERLVDSVRASIGNAQAIVLVIGLGFLEVAKPDLPPMTAGDRRHVLLRDADRYFPLEGVPAIASGGAEGVAFAMSSDLLQRFVRAFEEWAVLRAVVAAPDAIAASDKTSAHLVIDAGPHELGVLQLANGVVLDARRIPVVGADPGQSTASAPRADAEVARGKFSAAIGALALTGAPLHMMLLDASLEQALRGARVRRQWLSYALLSVALVAIVAAGNTRRDATLRVTQRAVDSLTILAVPGLNAQAQLQELIREKEVLATRTRPDSDPLRVLAILSDALPADAFVQRLEWTGGEWRLDGSVNKAATVVPRLDSVRTFANVRVLGPSTRFQDGTRMRESFSVAFSLKGDSVAHP